MAGTEWDSLTVGDPLPDAPDDVCSDADATCDKGSPDGWVCVRAAGHEGKHVAAIDPKHGPAVAVWSDEENFASPSVASYLPWNLHATPPGHGHQRPQSGSRASRASGRTSG